MIVLIVFIVLKKIKNTERRVGFTSTVSTKISIIPKDSLIIQKRKLKMTYFLLKQQAWGRGGFTGRDPFNQNSNRSDRENWSTSKGGPVFSKLFRLDRTDPLSFGPKFREILVEWIAPTVSRNFSRELEFDLARKLRHLIFHAALIHLSKIYFQV